jgi:DNA helicase-2/ATP-dependent DNA helicase PcrA
LTAQNDTVDALRAFFGRRLPIWEGHVREGLSALLKSTHTHKGDAAKITEAAITFLGRVATGFSPSQFGDTLLREASSGCSTQRRGKPALLQALARSILEQPNHVGVATMLHHLSQLIASEPAFNCVNIDYRREYWDAVHLGRFEDPEEGFSEISRRRSYSRPTLPAKAISTVHKAKGLECANVIIMPCDAQHFGDTPAARCRLYVAMSRATRSLTLVVSRTNPSPLIAL